MKQKPVKLSEIKETHNWICQFEPSDQQFARLLLDSLVLVSQQMVTRNLKDLIEHESNNVEGPIALIPVREVASNQSYYGNAKNKDAKAKLLLENSFPGSEAIIAQMSETMRRLGGSNRRFVQSPSLKNIRLSKCRTIFFLDDFIGSGKRLESFIESFEKHPTIRSWYSYQKVRYYAMAFSVTDVGYHAAAKIRRLSELKYVAPCPTFDSAAWSPEQRNAIIDICRRYAPNKHMQLGFADTKGLLIFEHSVPNNVPGILWKESKKWKALFPQRAVPSSLLKAFVTMPVTDDIELYLEELGQSRLASGHWRSMASPYIVKLILVLSAISNKAFNAERIRDKTRISLGEVNALLDKCREWELIDEDYKLTKAGLDELAHARRLTKMEDSQFAEPSKVYYPQKLRSVR